MGLGQLVQYAWGAVKDHWVWGQWYEHLVRGETCKTSSLYGLYQSVLLPTPHMVNVVLLPPRPGN